MNLPPELTSFIGRERETAEIKSRLSTARLVTLTGTGGVGKTRLALRVAADLREEFSDGVWWVDLQQLTDPSLLPRATMSALGIPEPVGGPLIEALVAYLRARSSLLVLDNCEHLLPDSAQFAGVLVRDCPQVNILTTSRERLGIDGEVTFRVPSLMIPDLNHMPAFERLKECEAVRLFGERAIMSDAQFRMTEENAKAVALVCQRLDGIPLALELAAARLKVLTVEQIASRLSDRFRLLTGGNRTSLRRHQTLRATMDWSYDLLTEPERTLFCRASVFSGGWTLEAAEAICAGGGIDASTVLDFLSQLVDKSLVVVETHGPEARYRLLETVRQYAAERLEESEEIACVRTNHRNWYLALAEEADLELRGPRQRVWWDRLKTEHDNLRAALDWSTTDQNGAEPLLRLAGALWWFWYRLGHWTEARDWLRRALNRGEGTSAAHLMTAIRGAAFLAHYSERAQARVLCEQGLDLAREAGRKEFVAWFLGILGNVARFQGEDVQATAYYANCVAAAREAGNKWVISLAVGQLELYSLRQGDPIRTMLHFEESLSLSRDEGDE